MRGARRLVTASVLQTDEKSSILLPRTQRRRPIGRGGGFKNRTVSVRIRAGAGTVVSGELAGLMSRAAAFDSRTAHDVHAAQRSGFDLPSLIRTRGLVRLQGAAPSAGGGKADAEN